MMVIFHVCYHNLRTSISQITDVTGSTCLASVLMKMLVAVRLERLFLPFFFLANSQDRLPNRRSETEVKMHTPEDRLPALNN